MWLELDHIIHPMLRAYRRNSPNFYKEIARVLYTDYVYAFEIAAVILLVGIVAATTLTARTRTDVKKLDPSKQIAVNKADRIRVVDLKQEPSE